MRLVIDPLDAYHQAAALVRTSPGLLA